MKKPEDLTDADIAAVEHEAVGQLYLDCLDATTAPPYKAKDRDRWLRIRSAARQRICDAINVRKGGSRG